MREIPAPGEPFERRLYFDNGEIERICADALKSAGCLPTSCSPIEIDLFVEKAFDCRVVYDSLPPGVLGAAAFRRDGKVAAITVSRSLDSAGQVGQRRARTTWAHEAGHGLLHGPLFAQGNVRHPVLDSCFDYKRRRILCREPDFRASGTGYDGKWWEWQANQAIGPLLLPRELVRTAVEPLTEERGMLGFRVLPSAHREPAARLLAETFDVNPAVARIRLSGLFTTDAQGTL